MSGEKTGRFKGLGREPKIFGKDVPHFWRDIYKNPKYRFRGRMHKVDSGSISEVGHYHWRDEDLLVMRVIFRNQRVYDCFPVSRDLFDGLLLSESKGKFFNEFIKDKPLITIEEVLED